AAWISDPPRLHAATRTPPRGGVFLCPRSAPIDAVAAPPPSSRAMPADATIRVHPDSVTRMAGASLLTLLDDIATLLDDVAVLTKASAKKTAGVLGDDLALNAQQVAGVKAHRELPVVWAVFKGSLLNKLVLVPAALLISWFLPWLVVPLMMLGGAYLCYEGFEKVVHKLFHRDAKPDAQARAQAVLASGETPQEMEKTKIRGAVRTDFILSAEIIVLSLAVVASEPL